MIELALVPAGFVVPTGGGGVGRGGREVVVEEGEEEERGGRGREGDINTRVRGRRGGERLIKQRCV